MDQRIALLMFISYLAVHVLYVTFVRYVGEGSAAKAASCSVAITLINIFGIASCVDDPFYVLPLSAGAFLGTYLAVHPDFSQRRLKMIRLFVIALVLCCCSVASVEAGCIARLLTAPVRGVNAIRVNRLEARAERGNPVAKARIENTHARMRGC